MSGIPVVASSRSLRSGGPVFASPNSNTRNPYEKVYTSSAAVAAACSPVVPVLAVSPPPLEVLVSDPIMPSDNSCPAVDISSAAGVGATPTGTVSVMPLVPSSVLSHPVLGMIFNRSNWKVGVMDADVLAIGVWCVDDVDIILVDDEIYRSIVVLFKPIPSKKFSRALECLRSLPLPLPAPPALASLSPAFDAPVVVNATVSRGENKKKKRAASKAAALVTLPFPPGKPGPSAAQAQPVQYSPAPSVLPASHLATPRNLDQEESISTPGCRTPSVSSASSVSVISSIGSRTLGAMLNSVSHKNPMAVSKSDLRALAQGTKLTLASRLAFPIPGGPGDLPVFMSPRSMVDQIENLKGGLTVLAIDGSVFQLKRELRKGQASATLLVAVCGPLYGPHTISDERLVMLQASVGIVVHPVDFVYMTEGWLESLQQMDAAADPRARTSVSMTRASVIDFIHVVNASFRAVFHDPSGQFEGIHARCSTFISSMPFLSAAIHSVTTAAFAHDAPRSMVSHFNAIIGDLWRLGRFGPAYLVTPVVLPPKALLETFVICLKYLGHKCPICNRMGMSEQICVFGSNCCKGPVATAAQDYVLPAADRIKALDAWSANQTDPTLSTDALRLAFNNTAEGKKFLEKQKVPSAAGFLYPTLAMAQQFMLDNQTLVTPAVSCLRSARG